ncbi:MAG: hypothetical protein EHM58_14775 [Ignavibacteriae bacterium]|nr:MAG: hypothetical protein EHM58_14775 [Ignavibacteriota bacterium]
MKRKSPHDLYAFSCLSPKATGLPMVIWISCKYETKSPCNIKVQNKIGEIIKPYEWISVTISVNPRVIGRHKIKYLDLVRKFILLNKKTLLDQWNYKTTSDEMIGLIKKIDFC